MVKKKTEIQWGKMNKNILKTKRKPQKIILKNIYSKRYKKVMRTDCIFYLLYFTTNKVPSSQRNTYKTHVFFNCFMFFYVLLKDLKNTI